MTDRDRRYRQTYVDIVDLEAKARGDVRSGHQPANVDGRDETGTAAWWLGELLDDMPAKQELHQTLWNYYEGRHPLPWLHDLDLVPHFDRLQRISRTNLLALVLEAVEERLDVEGFRVGSELANEERLWELWQINDLDELSQLANVMALVTGTSYSLTWVGETSDDDDGPPRSWVEDSMQVHHRWDLSLPRAREVRAAVKVWADGERDRADLYLPDGIHHYQRPKTATGAAKWVPEENDDHTPLPEQFLRVWPDGIVPVTPLVVRPDRLRRGRSELIECIPIQDRINQTIFDRLVAQSYASFQQVVGIGVQPEQDPDTGQEINPLKRNPARTWLIEAGGKIETIDPQSLGQMLDAHEQDVNAMARISRTPPNYLSTKMQFPSGDAVRGSDAGLGKKAHRRTRSLGGGYERKARLMAAADGEFDIARDATLETQWANVDIMNNSQLMDELVKARAGLEVPVEALWERWGATSTEIANWRRQRNLDLVLRGTSDVPNAPEQPQLPEVEDVA